MLSFKLFLALAAAMLPVMLNAKSEPLTLRVLVVEDAKNPPSKRGSDVFRDSIGAFSALNLNVQAISPVQQYEDTDAKNDNPDQYILRFRDWIMALTNRADQPRFDVAMVFTGHDLRVGDEDPAGLSFQGGLCDTYNIALVEVRESLNSKYNGATAHELGHLIGMSHVESGIMRLFADNSDLPIGFSQESKDEAAKTLGKCLALNGKAINDNVSKNESRPPVDVSKTGPRRPVDERSNTTVPVNGSSQSMMSGLYLVFASLAALFLM